MPFPKPGGGSGLDQLTGDVTAGPGTGSQAATLVGTTNVESVISGNATVAGAVQGASTPGGDLAGAGSTYTTPELVAVATAGTVGDASHYPVITIDAKGRVTTATATAVPSAVGASTYELEITATTATTVVTYTPTATGIYRVGVYFRVVTAATVVTVALSWTDATGAQTITLLNAVSEPVGSYTFNDVSLASTATAVSVTVTAGTANQVYASGYIREN